MLDGNGFIFRTQELRPIVYSLVEIKDKNTPEKFKLVEKLPNFSMPKKLYGDIEIDSYHIFDYFMDYSTTSVGVLLVGSAGTGKTLTAEFLCNLAIQSNLPVIYISSSKITVDLVKFISTFDNVVIYMDEYGKMSTWDGQEAFLSVLTSREKKNLYIFTENSASSINRYMLNRPGRIRYRIDFAKLPKKVLDEFCCDMGVSSKFKRELDSKYCLASEFSFDHLETLIKEHKYSPEKSLDELCRLLNIKHIITKFRFTNDGNFFKDKPIDKVNLGIRLRLDDDGREGFGPESQDTMEFNSSRTIKADLLDSVIKTPSRISLHFDEIFDKGPDSSNCEEVIELKDWFKKNKGKLRSEGKWEVRNEEDVTKFIFTCGDFKSSYKITTPDGDNVMVPIEDSE